MHARIKNVVYTSNGVLLSLKKEGDLAICNNVMALEDTTLSGSQSQEDKHCMTALT